MKNKTIKNAEERNRMHKKIWKSLKIEQAVKEYGFVAVRGSLAKWVQYQQANAKLLREKRELEAKLSEIEGKL